MTVRINYLAALVKKKNTRQHPNFCGNGALVQFSCGSESVGLSHVRFYKCLKFCLYGNRKCLNHFILLRKKHLFTLTQMQRPHSCERKPWAQHPCTTRQDQVQDQEDWGLLGLFLGNRGFMPLIEQRSSKAPPKNVFTSVAAMVARSSWLNHSLAYCNVLVYILLLPSKPMLICNSCSFLSLFLRKNRLHCL